ncbi:hypothetical protein BDV95DRAFT_78459 [Massariosphaeria phaeospora]|uniref:Uncharacterized protein n=1 Tax=Massariosphaeria phaeospora TaxID=100035 RepID=A0A7C8MA97_9PLEO|nr:hypothetical protein BDV95DRAFT_78459 [Massariosphaeria phaeospora]
MDGDLGCRELTLCLAAAPPSSSAPTTSTTYLLSGECMHACVRRSNHILHDSVHARSSVPPQSHERDSSRNAPQQDRLQTTDHVHTDSIIKAGEKDSTHQLSTRKCSPPAPPLSPRRLPSPPSLTVRASPNTPDPIQTNRSIVPIPYLPTYQLLHASRMQSIPSTPHYCSMYILPSSFASRPIVVDLDLLPCYCNLCTYSNLRAIPPT